MTRPGIDPGIFRLVAQRLNQYATPRLHVFNVVGIKIFFSEYRQGGCNMFFGLYYRSTNCYIKKDSNCNKFKYKCFESHLFLEYKLKVKISLRSYLIFNAAFNIRRNVIHFALTNIPSLAENFYTSFVPLYIN
jgi:hypothetical protein